MDDLDESPYEDGGESPDEDGGESPDEDGGEYDDPNDVDFVPIKLELLTRNSESPSELQVSIKPRKAYKQKRPKVAGVFTNDDNVKLIKAVEDRPILWDSSATVYSKLTKAEAWQEISEIVGHSSDACKARWGNLRVTFKTNITKYHRKKSGQATGESVDIVWKHFKSMLFLETSDVRTATESTSSMSLTNTEYSYFLLHFIDFPFYSFFRRPPPLTRRSWTILGCRTRSSRQRLDNDAGARSLTRNDRRRHRHHRRKRIRNRLKSWQQRHWMP